MSRILDEIKTMTQEERAELSAALKDLEQKPTPEARMIGEMADPRSRDSHGNRLSAEQIWDQEHPLLLKPYGFSETEVAFGKPAKTKYWSREEVDRYNEEQKRLWLKEKQKVFPDASLD